MKKKRVTIKSFMGTKKPDTDIENEFNYWRLIGLKGVVIDHRDKHPFYKNKGEQLLIQFDKDIKKLGLHTHNDIPNSLWVFKSDTKEI